MIAAERCDGRLEDKRKWEFMLTEKQKGRKIFFFTRNLNCRVVCRCISKIGSGIVNGKLTRKLLPFHL